MTRRSSISCWAASARARACSGVSPALAAGSTSSASWAGVRVAGSYGRAAAGSAGGPPLPRGWTPRPPPPAPPDQPRAGGYPAAAKEEDPGRARAGGSAEERVPEGTFEDIHALGAVVHVVGNGPGKAGGGSTRHRGRHDDEWGRRAGAQDDD